MLLFLNIDCVLAPPADALGPSFQGHTGMRRLEAVLHAWPRLKVVITSDRRYRMTLEHFRGFFSEELRRRVVAVTKLYAVEGKRAGRSREDEVLDFLDGFEPDAEDWLVLDRYRGDYPTHAERLVFCRTLTGEVVASLLAALRRCALAAPISVDLAVWKAGGGRALVRHPTLTRALPTHPKSLCSRMRMPGLAVLSPDAGRVWVQAAARLPATSVAPTDRWSS